MAIKRPDSWEPWEFENHKMRKSIPTDLAPEHVVDPNDDKYRAFLLTLAMIFNDFKGLVILNDTIKGVYRTPPTNTEVSGHMGEKEGIAVQMLKILFATLHEAFEFLEKSKEICESDKFKLLLQDTSNQNQLVWEMLIKIANNEEIGDHRFAEYLELRDFLVKARNNVGFHYQTHKQFIEGYRRFFISGISNVPPQARQFAYWSISSEFTNSRYYYADAALQGYYVNLFGDEKLARERTEKVFELLNLIVYAIHDILRKYHSSLPNR
ncbi:MAG: hypothetical protein A3D56_02480 [Candidatus Taylorbacteria bacterium RIFCSPHIGHO2_02_FULL_45_35]|uniref:Uncharacterized protein n=1 Tax=Candidatus Taylorbacteria bacterium RIFCSPHIGHO2_02_FULL_45_35 TaxID=1802311 RepID=A0A1G2MPV5_9BACT|nr:MAG: hypothetical protein A3D56_02480 [Candidatus Taylorbacteria bacterium RIFCSPHIGHO2_02_FULL_45_35]